jgi:hypothetical protein
MRRIRDQTVIEEVFESVDERLDDELTAYLMGGGAMTFRGLKNGTKDVDLLVASREDFDRLRELLYARGYEKEDDPIDEYASLGAALILDKDNACRFDIFDREVVRKLRLTEEMKTRATDAFVGNSLVVRALSNEDIFLFKGVAGRARDPDDMARIVRAGTGLDFEVIADEFESQLPLNSGAVERELFTEAPESHPVIAFERAVLSLPMTLPSSFTSVVEAEADRVYAEFELVNAVEGEESVESLTETLTSRGAVSVDGRRDTEAFVESLVKKDVLVRDGDAVQLRKFETSE